MFMPFAIHPSDELHVVVFHAVVHLDAVTAALDHHDMTSRVDDDKDREEIDHRSISPAATFLITARLSSIDRPSPYVGACCL